MNTKINSRLVLVILIIMFLIAGLAAPVGASFSDKLSVTDKLTAGGKRGDDPPWDPGDEITPRPVPDGIAIICEKVRDGVKDTVDILLIGHRKSDDPPWDPGDELEPKPEPEVFHA